MLGMARVATQLMLGKKLAEIGLGGGAVPHYGVKEAVFPFNMFPEVDPLLGPEMRSTGEVLGLAETFWEAFFKAQEAARQFAELNFTILATDGTAECLGRHGIQAQIVKKMHEGRPNIVDLIKNRQIHLIINTPAGKQSQYDDSYIRKNAIKHKVPYITTLAGAVAAAGG